MNGFISLILSTCSLFSLVNIVPSNVVPSNAQLVNSQEISMAITSRLPRKDAFWSEENINLLTKEQQQELAPIKEKLSKGEGLTAEEAEIHVKLKETVIKAKLGEADYKNYQNLIEKRKSGIDLTPEDKQKLYEIRKKLKPGKHPENTEKKSEKENTEKSN